MANFFCGAKCPKRKDFFLYFYFFITTVVMTRQNFHSSLMNKLMPGCIKKIDTKGGGFALMQNLERFQAAAKEWGVPVREVFQTVDLWERKNIPQVTLCLHALARVVSCF